MRHGRKDVRRVDGAGCFDAFFCGGIGVLYEVGLLGKGCLSRWSTSFQKCAEEHVIGVMVRLGEGWLDGDGVED